MNSWGVDSASGDRISELTSKFKPTGFRKVRQFEISAARFLKVAGRFGFGARTSIRSTIHSISLSVSLTVVWSQILTSLIQAKSTS